MNQGFTARIQDFQTSFQQRMFLTTMIFLCSISAVIAAGMECRRHPLYRRGMRGEIIQSWHYKMDEDGNQMWYKSVYQPRFVEYQLAPEKDPKSRKYAGLDVFATNTAAARMADFATIEFQRTAKTYLLVAASNKVGGTPQLAGWKSEGWVRQAPGKAKSVLEFGFGEEKDRFTLPSAGYLFVKTGRTVVVPTKSFIKSNVKHLATKGRFVILVAERDAGTTRALAPPGRMKITPGGLCPNELHNAWTVKGPDSQDAATRDKDFRTWHPLYDPCWWCSYGHEHGSAAPLLMDYKPRYDYAVLKHRGDTELESHAGFKDFVLDTPTHRVYYGIHMHVSNRTRFATRHHTVVVVVKSKETGQVEYDTRVKADFGALTVRKRVGGLVGVTPEMERLREQLGDQRRQRLVNVLDPSNPTAGGFKQRKQPKTRKGRYEQWMTVPLCSKTQRKRGPAVDVKDPATALKKASLMLRNNVVKLGRVNSDGRLRQGLNINREFRADGWILSDSACSFTLPYVHTAAQKVEPKSNTVRKFYTDPYGEQVYDGPGESHLVQYIRPGFKLQITGKFMTNDTWLGLYRDGDHGAMWNVMNGVMPGVN